MGIFDKVEQDAEDMTHDDPKLAQQATRFVGGQAGQDTQDMQAAQNMIGQQRGAKDQDRDGTDQGHHQDMANQDPDQDADQDRDQDPGQG
jgi:hypothetical protein